MSQRAENYTKRKTRAMIWFSIVALFGCLSAARPAKGQTKQPEAFRPPAVPLVTHDPYFSVWSTTDLLTASWPKHWTGANMAMSGLLRIDGHAFRFMGPGPSRVPAMTQRSLAVLPTRTIYEFEASGVQLTVTFLSPVIPTDIQLFARPASYVTFTTHSTDDASHRVWLYFDCSAEWVVNAPSDPVEWSRLKLGDVTALSFGSQHQPVLERAGDDVRIDWGHLYIVAPPGEASGQVVTSDRARGTFADTGALPDSDDLRMPRPANDDWPVLAFSFDFGELSESPVSRWLALAYDDEYSIEFFERKLRPAWRAPGVSAAELLRAALRDYPVISQRAQAFDDELMSDLRAAGGEEYAQLAALAFRQAAAAHKLARDVDGTPLLFAKENFSGGFIGTVDVIYPCSPFFLFFNPHLLEAQLRPVLEYASLPRWPFAYAPHDLGMYPKADGQLYGGGEKSDENQMPVEETANMLLMIAGIAKAEGNANFATPYWNLLTRWAKYLQEKGFDPENQLSTDDFAGHLAHNANLSIKAILGLGAYAQLCRLSGRAKEADDIRHLAEGMSAKWVTAAADGDHYSLAFDKPGTWSQKYNLVWDNLLGLNLFDPAVARREVAFYLAKQNRYGLPLDSRKTYTKLDWILWTATLADSRADFEALVAPAYRFANETPSRVPLTDWYDTLTAKQQAFQARSVVGGIFVKLLADPAMWKKWAGRAEPR